MSKLAVDLMYQPVGGALAQIKEVIKSVEAYSFNQVVFYLTKENRYLFDGCESKKVVLNLYHFRIPQLYFGLYGYSY